ncbi:hypothetical protein MKQ68_14450 [Chitinophaga horti]|uniref:DUF4595 domain-containing protein n=1 Tax=Chitinophaga horti TaxID=2920382 RepID=A0ABY6IV95_9BACT|nr:hypothetical protein [Chitinophaga horti]UYQ91290.1 hypothetical protein MKQ68_14450 [Chitinophaga horti]
MLRKRMLIAALGVTFFTACSKEASLPEGPEKGAEAPAGKPKGPFDPAAPIVTVRAAITVGKVRYDSIPGTLSIIAWDTLQASRETTVALKPGPNDIALPAGAVKYQLKLSKWGVTADTTVQAADLAKIDKIILAASKAAKRLTGEEKYTSVGNTWRADSKSKYSYQADGNLESVLYYGRRAGKEGLFINMEDFFVYEGGRLTTVKRYDENGDLWIATHLGYNDAGELISLKENKEDKSGTSAAINYLPERAQVKFNYQYANGNTMGYTQQYRNGNLVEDAAYSSRGGSETSKYRYDFFINPFAQLNYPDMFLSRRSKHNRTGEEKNYGGNIPSSVPYEFTYTYDEDGYPIQLLTSFKGFMSNEHLFTIKTVYKY